MSDLITERTQEPTPHRRDQVRRSGPSVRSSDLIAAALGLAACGFLAAQGPSFVMQLGKMLRTYLTADMYRTIAPQDWTLHLYQLGSTAMWSILPISSLFLLLTVALQIAQGGVRWQPERIRPDVDRFNPSKQFEQLVDGTRVMQTMTSTLKTFAVGFLVGGVLWSARGQILGLVHVNGESLAVLLPQVVLRCLTYAVALLLGLGVADYGIRRWRHDQQMKMSADEIREETKAREGDPLLRGRRRELHRDYAQSNQAINEIEPS